MKISTLKRSDYSFTNVTALLFTPNGVALTAAGQMSVSLNALVIKNASGGDLVFAINGGAPFLVTSATTFEYGLGAQGTSHVLTKLEVNAANLSGVTIFGE